MNILNAKLYEARHFCLKYPEYSSERVIMDYEFDFYLDVSREMIIDHQKYLIDANTLVFRTPGQIVKSKGDYDCYIISLSFTDSESIENYRRETATIMQPKCSSRILDMIPCVSKPAHFNDIKEIFEKIIQEFTNYGNSDITHNLLMQLFFLVASDTCQSKIPSTAIKTSTMQQICAYIRSNYTMDLSIDVLANKAGLSKCYFIRKFKKEIGISPVDYLIKIRLDNAKILLNKTDCSIKEIAYLCGYHNTTFFSTAFKQAYGCTPSDYRALFLPD